MAERGYPFTYILRAEHVRENLIRFIRSLPIANQQVSIREERRSDEHSERMHAMLGDISKQVVWCGARLSTEDWKRFATAMLKKDRFVRDCDDRGQPGTGRVVIGARTREMSAREINEVITWCEWFGAQHNVRFKDPRADAPVPIGSSVGETPGVSVSRT